MGLGEVAWAITSAVGAIGIGIASAVSFGSSVTRGEVLIARLCLILPTAMLGLTELGWLMFTDAPWWWRVATGIAVGAVVFVGLPEGLRWISHRQSATASAPEVAPSRVEAPVIEIAFTDFLKAPGVEVPVHDIRNGKLYLEKALKEPIEVATAPGETTPRINVSAVNLGSQTIGKVKIVVTATAPIYSRTEGITRSSEVQLYSGPDDFPPTGARGLTSTITVQPVEQTQNICLIAEALVDETPVRTRVACFRLIGHPTGPRPEPVFPHSGPPVAKP